MSRNVDHRFLQDLLKQISAKHKNQQKDSFPSAPPGEVNSSSRSSVTETDFENDVAMKEMSEEEEREKDKKEEKSNETRFGAKSKKKTEFMDIHMAMSPRAPGPSNLADNRNPNQPQEHLNKTGKVTTTKYK